MIVLVNGIRPVLPNCSQRRCKSTIERSLRRANLRKRVVESVLALSEETGLALTTAQYFTPAAAHSTASSGTALAAPGRELDPATDSSHFHTDDGRPVSPSGESRGR